MRKASARYRPQRVVEFNQYYSDRDYPPLHLACKYGRSHAEQIRQSDLKINQRQAQASFAARLGMQPKEGVCLKNFLVIPDSFKGSISSSDVCRIAEAAIKEIMPDASVRKIPVADGGEGSVEAFLEALGGEKRYLTVRGRSLKMSGLSMEC